MISSAPKKVATRTNPVRSNRRRRASSRSAIVFSDSRRITAIRAIVTRPTGPLIMKHQRQERLSASHPPSVGPTTGATTTAMPKRAKACPLFCGGNESARIDWAAGTMPPPASPCRMRDMRSASRLQASAQATELKVKTARQVRKKVLRPSRRATKGLAVRLTALATRLVVTTQEASSSLTPILPAI